MIVDTKFWCPLSFPGRLLIALVITVMGVNADGDASQRISVVMENSQRISMVMSPSTILGLGIQALMAMGA